MRNAFSDGSNDDEAYFAAVKAERRKKMSPDAAVAIVTGYLDKQVEVLKIDVRRFRAMRDREREVLSIAKIEWCEAIKLWIETNI